MLHRFNFLQYYKTNLSYKFNIIRELLDPFLSITHVHPSVQCNIYIKCTLKKKLKFCIQFKLVFPFVTSFELVGFMKCESPGPRSLSCVQREYKRLSVR